MVGGAGFIGSHFADITLEKNEIEKVLAIDSLTYAGSKANLVKAFSNEKFDFLEADINDSKAYRDSISGFDAVVNFAAESHVDRSITNPNDFFMTNSVGVATLTRTCMESNVGKLIQVSTDEVYGPMESGVASEKTILNPSSPYSASKAAGEMFAVSFWKTFGFPVCVTRGSNTFGPRQFPEKLIPLALSNLRLGKKIPVYGSGMQVREWIYVSDHANAIYQVLMGGKEGSIYNIGSGDRISNLELLRMLLKKLNLDEESLEFVEDRKGHDFRYAIDSALIETELGWKAKFNLSSLLNEIDSW